MKQKILFFLKSFIPFSIILFLGQLAIRKYALEDLNTYYSTASIYIFLVVSTFLIYLFLVFVHQNFKEKTGFAFMGMGLLKMLAAIIFLLPMLTSKVEEPFKNLLLFFIPYFLFLILETTHAVKLLNSK